jgi:O-acetyl-ADP-ribose deacetylase (regulator of RNase III)
MAVKVTAAQGDITEADTEAIVNAANNHLWMGSGVAGAIKSRGGAEIEKDAMAKGPIEVGQAVASIAGKLRYKYIIHAAGMGQDLRTDEDIIYEVTKNSLLLADSLRLKSLAFPALGAGVGGLSAPACAKAMIKAVREIEDKLQSPGKGPGLDRLERVVFVLFDKETYRAFSEQLKH